MSYPGILPAIGDRVRITALSDDPQPLEVGSVGTVTGINSYSEQIFVDWDSGRGLILLFEDSFEII